MSIAVFENKFIVARPNEGWKLADARRSSEDGQRMRSSDDRRVSARPLAVDRDRRGRLAPPDIT